MMAVLDDILKGISPVMGAYRETAWKEVRELRDCKRELEKLVDAIEEVDKLEVSMSKAKAWQHVKNLAAQALPEKDVK